jgi:hypothetical protein
MNCVLASLACSLVVESKAALHAWSRNAAGIPKGDNVNGFFFTSEESAYGSIV